MPVLGSTSPDPKPAAFDWISDTRHAGAVDRAQVGGVAIAARRPAVRGSLGVDQVEPCRRCDRSSSSPSAVSLSTSGRSNPAAVAASISRWAKATSLGSAGRSSATGQFGRTEREVALRVRRQRPQVDPEGVRHQRRHPLGQRSGEVVVAVEAGAERLQPVAELAFVERRATALDDGLQRPSCAGATNPGAGTGELAEQLGEVFAGAFVGARRGPDEQRDWRGSRRRRDRWPAASSCDSGSVPNRSCNAIHPSTQPGTVTASDVVAERHLGVTLGPQRCGDRHPSRRARSS